MRPLVPEDYVQMVRLSSLAAAPDGALAYVQYFWQENAWQRRVELTQGGETKAVSIGGIRETCPIFSNDGRRLWFLSDGRVALYDRETGSAREAFSLPEGFEALDVLPLRDGCVFSCRRELRKAPPEGCDWQMPLVTEELRFRDDGDHGWKKRYEYRLCLYRGSVRVLAEGGRPYRALALLPDESAVLAAQDGFFLIDLSDGEIRALSAPFQPGRDVRPAIAPDGSYALVAASCGMESRLGRLWLDGREHGPDQTENEPAGLSEGLYMDLAPERKSLIARGQEAGTFYVSAVRGHRPALFKVEVREEAIVYTELEGAGLPVETAGETAFGVALLSGDAGFPPRPAFWKDGAFRFASPDPNPWLAEACPASPQLVRTPSQDGCTELGGYLLLPEGRKENIPLLVWVHGGPSGCWAPGFCLETQCAVSQGFAVLLPNPRGSTGRGGEYSDPAHAFDGGAANDILCLLDEALRRFSCLDGRQVSVLGGSYGGFMAAWMAGRTARFRCAVVIKGVTNWLFIHFRSSQAGQPVMDEYWDFQDFLVDTVKSSPIYDAGDVNIPTLIIHGEKDQQVPVENAHQYYTALKDCHPDLPVRLMLLPDACHGYSRDGLPDYIAVQRETIRWLNTYGKETAP